MGTTLWVEVNGGFRLDAGEYSVEQTADHLEYRITPPAQPMLEQVIALLEPLPVSPVPLHNRYLGVGLTALAMRWGSYLAALCEPSYPLYQPDRSTLSIPPDAPVSRISDWEMRRLNIEVSANLACLGRLFYDDRRRLFDLLVRACTYLPIFTRSTKSNLELRETIAVGQLSGSLRMYAHDAPDDYRRLMVEHYAASEDDMWAFPPPEPLPGDPDRIIGNYLTLRAWRNTIVEDFHAGTVLTIEAPLLPAQRRFSLSEERRLMRALCSSGYEIVHAWWSLYDDGSTKVPDAIRYLQPYPKSAQAVYNAGFMAHYPYDWSTTDRSAEVVLTHSPDGKAEPT